MLRVSDLAKGSFLYRTIKHIEAWYRLENVGYWYQITVAWLGGWISNILDAFKDYPLVIQVAITSIVISLISIISSFVALLNRTRKNKKKFRTKKQLIKRFSNGIMYLLSEDAPANATREQILKALDIDKNENPESLLKNDQERFYFCRLLYLKRISKDMVEGRSANVSGICKVFNIQPFLEKKINYGNNIERAESLRMMWAFRLPVNAWMTNQINDNKYNRIRRMANYATMASSMRVDLNYFESEFFEENCCMYDEIQLGYILQQRRAAGQKLPDLSHWVRTHKSAQTQCIFIRLMRKFSLEESCAALEELFLNTNDTSLLNEIARTWGYLHYLPGEKIMSDVLFLQPDETKIAIVHALTRIGTGESLETLINTYNNSTSPQVRLEVLRCLYNYGDAGLQQFEQLEAQAKPEDTQIFEFFHNRLSLKRLSFDDSDDDEEFYEDNMFSVK